jgi:mycothiol synthase
VVIRPATSDDLEPVVELIGTRNRAATGVAGIRPEHLRAGWELSGFSLETDSALAEEGGRIVGYAAVMPSRELVVAATEGDVVEELLARVIERARGRGDETVTVVVRSSEDPMNRVVERHPFELVHETLLMWRPLAAGIDEPRLPDGLTVRTFGADDARAVHDLLDEAYRAWDPLWVPMAYTDWVRWMTGDPEFHPSVWWLAEREGALAGCALHWTSGWLKDLAVRDSERGRGLGAALVGLGLAEFARRGLERVGLKVDAGNPTGAVRLYEKLGFVTASREAVWAWSL